MKSVGIRWRLTLWYGAVVAAVLISFSGLLYFVMREFPAIDEPLLAEVTELEHLVRNAPDLESVASRCDRYFRRREGYMFQVRTAQGETIFSSERLGDSQLPVPSGLVHAGHPILEDAADVPEFPHLRVASMSILRPGGPLTVQAAVSMATYDEQLWRLQLMLMAMVPLAVAGALWGGYQLASRALAPLDKMVETASMITALQLNRRIAVTDSKDELGRLGETINNMISRLERSFEEVRRFTADAAHELRTPLAIMRSEAEIALRSPRSSEEYRRVIESMLEETAQLSTLTEQLLFLCREDSGLRTGSIETVAVSEVLDDLIEQMQVSAKEKSVSIQGTIAPDCLVSGDPQGLRRLFLNLIDNAIKYCHQEGSVTIACHRAGDSIEVTVRDTGCGISETDLPLIFDRFYRVDSSRTPDVKGTGLGLSIARSIAEAHGGSISCESTLGVGSLFRVLLPAVVSAPERRSRGDHARTASESRSARDSTVLAR